MKRKQNRAHTLGFFLLVGIVLFSVGGTLNYYFYSDDYTWIYFVQQNVNPPAEYIPVIRYIFGPLVKFFGLHPLPYFLLGIITYIAATLSVYALIKSFTKNIILAYASSFIFATGYIGLDQFRMMIVSSFNNISIIFMIWVIIWYKRFLESGRLKYYIISLLVAGVALFLIPYRTYSLLLFIPTMEFVYVYLHKVRLSRWLVLRTIILTVPFFLIGKYVGIIGYGGSGPLTIQFLLAHVSPLLMTEFFAVLGRLLLSEAVRVPFHIAVTPFIYAWVGIAFFFVSSVFVILLCLSKHYRSIGLHLLFLSIFTLESYVGNFILVPTFALNGAANRYLPMAFVGLSSWIVVLFWAVGKLIDQRKRYWYTIVSITFCTIYIVMLSVASHNAVTTLVKEEGMPARAFIESVRNDLPVMPSKLTIYMDYAQFDPAIRRFGNILSNAHYPYEVTFAVQYGVPIDQVRFTTSFEEYLSWMKTSTYSGEVFRSYYYDGEHLQNTTEKIRASLRDEDTVSLVSNIERTISSETNKRTLFNVEGIPSYGIYDLYITLTMYPVNASSVVYPYYFNDRSETRKREARDFYEVRPVSFAEVFAYLASRSEYYRTVSVVGKPSHVAYPPSLLIDNRLDTWWLHKEALWQVGKKPDFVLDLGSVRNISRILWIPLKGREFDAYSIFLSLDGVSWKHMSVSSQTFETTEQVIVSDSFSVSDARYIKYEIQSTKNGQTPGVIEMEVIEDSYADLDPFVTWRISSSPFEYTKTLVDFQKANDFIVKNATVKVYTQTDGEDEVFEEYMKAIPAYVDGLKHTYIAPITSRGTMLKKIGIEVSYPVNLYIDEILLVRKKLIP